MAEKLPKEIAFVREHFVAPEWSERFTKIVDEKLELPSKGKFLYVEAGTGTHALELSERLGEDVALFLTDAQAEAVKIAQDKARALAIEAQIETESPFALSFVEDEFDVVLADASFIAPQDLTKFVAELARVTDESGDITFFLPTAGSFGEFFSVLWETVFNADLLDESRKVEDLIQNLPTVSEAEAIATRAGLSEVKAATQNEFFDFKTGAEFLAAPLVTEVLLPVWLREFSIAARKKINAALVKMIDAERGDLDFRLTVKATVITGKKL